MSNSTLYRRYTTGLFIFIAGSFVVTNMVLGGEITYPADSYDSGDTLTASDLNSKFNEIKTVVNNNSKKSTLNDLSISCNDGQVAKWNEKTSLWECKNDVNTDTLANLTSCSKDQIAKWNGTAWTCADDIDMPDSLTSCSKDQTAKWNGTAWICADDIDAAGLQFASSSEDIPLDSNGTKTIQKVTISAPGQGFIIVSYSAYYFMLHTNGSSDIMEVGISDQDPDVSTVIINGLVSRRYLYLDSNFATGSFSGTVAAHQVFDVLVKGDYTYYVVGASNKPPPENPLSPEFFVSHSATQAVFVPKRAD